MNTDTTSPTRLSLTEHSYAPVTNKEMPLDGQFFRKF